jgi:hypothetical protein
MATAKIQIAPERIADGKRLYEMTLTPVPDIAAMMGISRKTLERRIHEWGWTLRSAPRLATERVLAAMAPTGAVVNAEPKAAVAVSLSPVTRTALAARIHGIVEQGLDAVERVLSKVGPADESGAKRSARTLAAVARTLQEMAALTKPEAEVMPPDDADDDDPIPRDINEFRRELARRIRGFIEARRLGAGRILDQRESEVD